MSIGGCIRVDHIHTGLYGEAAEIVLSLAWLIGKGENTANGLTIYREASNYIMLAEVRTLDIYKGSSPTYDAFYDLYLAASNAYKFRTFIDIYRDEFGEVIIVAEHEDYNFTGDRSDFSSFSQLYKINDNLKRLAKVIFIDRSISKFSYRLMSKLVVKLDEETIAGNIATKNIELSYKDAAIGVVTREDFNEIMDYIIGCRRKHPIKKDIPLFTPLQNPIEIEARKIKREEESAILADFARECDIKAYDFMSTVTKAIGKVEDAIVKDFKKHMTSLRRLS